MAICSLRPKELPDLGSQEVPVVPRPALGGEDRSTEGTSMQHVLALILQQNGQLKDFEN